MRGLFLGNNMARHLTDTVAFYAVPVPAAVWLLGSSLIGLGGADTDPIRIGKFVLAVTNC